MCSGRRYSTSIGAFTQASPIGEPMKSNIRCQYHRSRNQHRRRQGGERRRCSAFRADDRTGESSYSAARRGRTANAYLHSTEGAHRAREDGPNTKQPQDSRWIGCTLITPSPKRALKPLLLDRACEHVDGTHPQEAMGDIRAYAPKLTSKRPELISWKT